jgi:hypothetical protein
MNPPPLPPLPKHKANPPRARASTPNPHYHTPTHTRQYGVGLGLIKPNGPWGFLALPNAVYGMVLYLAIFLTNLPSTFASARARQIALILSTCSLFVSVYLGYLLAFVLKNLCVVCVATYLVNAALFSLCWADYKRALSSLRTGCAYIVHARAHTHTHTHKHTQQTHTQTHNIRALSLCIPRVA